MRDADGDNEYVHVISDYDYETVISMIMAINEERKTSFVSPSICPSFKLKVRVGCRAGRRISG